jgi:hypothetical protein
MSGEDCLEPDRASASREARGPEKRPSLRRSRRHLFRKPLRNAPIAGQTPLYRQSRSKIRKNKENSRGSNPPQDFEEDKASEEQN